MTTPVSVNILAIGGGGAGGSDAGSGGGGGGLVFGTAVFDEQTTYNVVIGSGGQTPSQPGQPSYVVGFPFIAYGGQGGGGVYNGYTPGGGAAGGLYNVTGGYGGTGARGGNPQGQNGQTIGPYTAAGGGGGEIDYNNGSPEPGGYGGGLAGNGGYGAGWNQRNNTPGFAYGGGGGGGGNYGGQGSAGAAGVVTISYVNDLQVFNGGSITSAPSGSSTQWTHTFTSNGQLVPSYTQALPTFGPLSLGAIRNEFGGPTPIPFSSYYKGGSYVTNYSYAPHVPASGTIKISEFYGTAQYVPQSRSIQLSDGQSWTVPVTIQGPITLELISGAGGNGGNDVDPGYGAYPGHLVVSTLTVNPGDTVLASVGGAGVGGGSGSGSGTQGQGGYGGVFGYTGGTGGWAGYAGWSGGGGGGGGATAVKHNGSLIAVAGGGGGGGGGGWHSSGRGQVSGSTGVITGGQGTNKDGHDGNDGGGGGGGGGGYFGGIGGPTVGGDEGAYSGADGQNLIPTGGSSTTTISAPSVVILGLW